MVQKNQRLPFSYIFLRDESHVSTHLNDAELMEEHGGDAERADISNGK